MTAADQPTTEPSAERAMITGVVAGLIADHQFAGLAGQSHDDPGGIRWGCGCGHEERIDGMAGYPSWRAAHAIHAADELLAVLAPALQPAADQRCTACDGRGDEGSTYMNSGACQTCRGTGRQPAADTETEVQWGVRYRDGHVVTAPSEDRAHDYFNAQPDLVVVCRTVAPWEEA